MTICRELHVSKRTFRDERGRMVAPESCALCGKVYRSPMWLRKHIEEHDYPEARGPEVAAWEAKHRFDVLR